MCDELNDLNKSNKKWFLWMKWNRIIFFCEIKVGEREGERVKEKIEKKKYLIKKRKEKKNYNKFLIYISK